MAYARIAKDSDVYVYEDYAGFISEWTDKAKGDFRYRRMKR